jgi:hypothetical protein
LAPYRDFGELSVVEQRFHAMMEDPPGRTNR